MTLLPPGTYTIPAGSTLVVPGEPPPPGQHTLTVTQVGQGSVTFSPPPLAQTHAEGTVVVSYASGTHVMLSGSPAPGWTGPTWSGDCDANGHLVIDSDKSCTATFQEAPIPSPGGFVYGPVPADGYKKSNPSSSSTYLFRPVVREGQRLSGIVTIAVEAHIQYYLNTMDPATVPHRLVVDGVPQPSFTIDTRQWPDGTHVLAIQVMSNPNNLDVGSYSKVVVFNNSGVPFTKMTEQATAGGFSPDAMTNLAWGRVDVKAPQPANLGHNPGNHPNASTDQDRQRLATEKIWWIDQLTQPGTGLYFNMPLLMKNAEGDYFIQQWYPALNDKSHYAAPGVLRQPAYDGPRGLAVLTGYTTLIRGLRPLASGHTGWLGVSLDGRVVDLDVSGEVTTIFGPRSKAGVVQTDPYLEDVNLPERIARGEKEFVGDQSGGTLLASQDLWMSESAPDQIYIADLDNNRVAILDRTLRKLVGSIPLPGVTSVWGDASGFWAVSPASGLHRLAQGQATLVAAIANAFWVRGTRDGKLYVMTDSFLFYEHNIATGMTTLRKPNSGIGQHSFAFFDIDVDGVIGPKNRIYFGSPHMSTGAANASIAWLDPTGTWAHHDLDGGAPLINFQIYGSWMGNSNPFGHYPWGFGIHATMTMFVVFGISAGVKVWTGHLGPQPNPDAAIPGEATHLFRYGHPDEYLGLGAIFGHLGHGLIGYHVDQWRDLKTWPESRATMRAAIDPLLPAAMSEADKEAVTQMMWAQRTRSHFQ